jgi:signal transduction histidine kinase
MARVLIVDDERSIRITLAEFLREDGFDVDTAEDAFIAEQLLRAGSYDVVVSDVILPKINGVELLHKIRGASPHVQVIIMTGEPTVETASEAVRAGASDYLFKPITKQAILRAVSNASRVKSIDDEKRRLEEVNRKYQEDLEHLVDERTAALVTSNRKLKEAMADLKKAHEQVIRQERLRALGQMVSGIAHDFNNLLMPILGMTDFLLDDPEMWQDVAETRSTLETIKAAATDAREIVRRLREFYNPGEQLATVPLDLDIVVQEVVSLTESIWRAQAEAEGRSVELEVDVAEAVEVQANGSQLHELLTNLIINAVDAMPEGGTISVKARGEDKRVAVEVSDTGTGMPEDIRKRCLEPFFSTKGERGTGMGLAMCYGIVQRHGGKLDIESVSGQGTTVRFTLPVALEEAASETQQPRVVSAVELNVLVADDEVWVQKVLSKCLERDGHGCVVVATGEECLAQLASQPFDLVITDRAMPQMSGDEVARRVKETHPDLPVIMLTGFGDIMNYADELPEGVDLVLSKPVTPEELREAIVGVTRARG